jgi:hypothetical protein
VIRALVLVAFPSGLRFESSWPQTIPWGQSAGEAVVLPDPCGGDALYGSKVYSTGVGTRCGSALEGFLFINIYICVCVCVYVSLEGWVHEVALLWRGSSSLKYMCMCVCVSLEGWVHEVALLWRGSLSLKYVCVWWISH